MEIFQEKKESANAQCLKYPKTIACKGSSTSGLVRHLAHVHKINITKWGTQEESESEASTSSGVSTQKKKQAWV